MKYELQIGSRITKGDDLESLMKKGFEEKEYFEVYQIIPSSMGTVKLANNSYIDSSLYYQIGRLFIQGWSKISLKDRFKISDIKLNLILKQQSITT